MQIRSTGKLHRFRVPLPEVRALLSLRSRNARAQGSTVVDHFGYHAAFLMAAGVAAVALLVLATAMPETADLRGRDGTPFASLALANVKSPRADLD
jgi:hypothetical protein